MDVAVIALSAVAAILGGITGAAGCWLVLNHRVEAMAATVRASVLADPADRVERIERHRAAWRAVIWHWIQLHLPHRRAAA